MTSCMNCLIKAEEISRSCELNPCRVVNAFFMRGFQLYRLELGSTHTQQAWAGVTLPGWSNSPKGRGQICQNLCPTNLGRLYAQYSQTTCLCDRDRNVSYGIGRQCLLTNAAHTGTSVLRRSTFGGNSYKIQYWSLEKCMPGNEEISDHRLHEKYLKILKSF